MPGRPLVSGDPQPEEAQFEAGLRPRRLADFTGFFLLGKLIEIGDTKKIFQNPAKKETEDYVTGRFG